VLSQSHSSQRIVRLVFASLGLLVCLWGLWNAGRAGLSRLLSEYAVLTLRTPEPLLAPANEAVGLTPKDPEAHFARALLLERGSLPEEAAAEHERAAALRPRDYYLWMMLGNSREGLDDEEGALAALSEAVRLAPYYAQPRWQLGNALFRAGRADEGFEEMRRAALSNQTLLPNMIDLAWGASNKDPAATESLVRPETKQWRVALAHFFARKGQAAEALKLYRAAGGLAEAERQTLVSELLATKGYAEAYEVWAAVENGAQTPSTAGGAGQFTNGSFESQLSFAEQGFGWQFARDPNTLKFSLDTVEPRAGKFSLRLDWNGNAQPNAPVASQLLLVEPNSRYRLTFAARTQEIVSGALPRIVLVDKNSVDNHVLAQSATLGKGSNNWQDYTLEFTTGSETRAVLVGLQRESCGAEPCPIFGRLWLDAFSAQKL
jgi:hypothetical protein